MSVNGEKTRLVEKPKKEASALEGCSYEMMSAYTMFDSEGDDDDYPVGDTADYLADVSRIKLIQKIFNETKVGSTPCK